MYAQRFTVPVTTASDGTATAYTPVFTGQVLSIGYVKDGTVPFSNGVAFAVTSEATGQTVWGQTGVNASATVSPRQATHGTDGTASLFAAAGTAVQGPIVLANDRLQIAVSGGGNAKAGSFVVIVA